MIKKYDIALVVGTRPNFVKAAPLLKKLEENNKRVLFIHTGQHFDKSMSNNIFEDLKLRNPDLNLDAPKDSQSKQFQYIVEELEKVFKNFKIDKVGVFGDVTSTLAASIAAKNANKYLFHVESGLRSKNLNMPEERNRIMVDAVSDLLLIPSDDAMENLLNEKVSGDKIFNVGNIMIDTLSDNKEKIIENLDEIKEKLNITKPYFVMTLHRPSNLTDNILNDIFQAVGKFTESYEIILPAHPRLKNFIDNQKIKDVNLNSLRKEISIVDQNTTLFDDTVFNNIKYAKPSASDEEIYRAAKISMSSDFIEKLEHKFETYIGENGVKLSGGEKQRLSIARALLKDSKIILLDEATSSLDSETEEKIQKAIEELTKNKTTVVIAHRLSTILNSEKIYVVDKGSVESSGKHDDLIKNSLLYKNFYERQIKNN